MKFNCLSIVSPSCQKIADKLKTIEVRSWKPNLEFGDEILIIENDNYLSKDKPVDLNGKVVALVKLGNVRKYVERDIKSACATKWVEGYYSWELFDVLPFSYEYPVAAQLGIYELDLNIE